MKENIIAIRKRSISQANEAFEDFMHKTERCFNERSITNPRLYKNISPSDLERATESLLKEIAPSTPFRPEEIKLVAGHAFPDIMAEKYYGVEVKSTKENKWTSTGSSIVETTRDKFVESVYLLFGNLGVNPPTFKCKPYQECLSNIAVTHSPRYLIDMEIREKQGETIFEKLNTTYQDFCKNEERIEIVRDYYIQQARIENKQEMPWWVGKRTIEMSETGDTPLIHLMANCSPEEVKSLKAQMVILFPRVVLGEYAEAALWLCTHRYILNLSFRDLFSAGGQWTKLNGRELRVPYPAVLGRLMEVMPEVKMLMEDKDLEIREFNPGLYYSNNKFSTWFHQINNCFNQYNYKVNNRTIMFSDLNIDLMDYLLHPENYKLEHPKK